MNRYLGIFLLLCACASCHGADFFKRLVGYHSGGQVLVEPSIVRALPVHVKVHRVIVPDLRNPYTPEVSVEISKGMVHDRAQLQIVQEQCAKQEGTFLISRDWQPNTVHVSPDIKNFPSVVTVQRVIRPDEKRVLAPLASEVLEITELTTSEELAALQKKHSSPRASQTIIITPAASPTRLSPQNF